ncbi:hypothetical protein ACFO1B_17150 [Dactylosporangium siamense]|uniref:DUF1963 domain-containing protein n=1 Tax=Dactylosporangium siamense TaxID=685454 RepID=A0A919UCE5_9ACTN|nr:hypothetical protein [Dactylosporangium siamense]GIG45568.1 hypothetical protein Dsi01nite_036090 [Dactylosporangium siamense]
MYFVYRTHYEGPFSLRIRRLPDRGVLDWFRRGWDNDAPWDWIEAELGGPVYGLASIFEAAQEEQLPRPGTVDELRTLLHEHLYVEGDTDYIRLDGQSLRARTNDDEVELAYFFLHDDLATARADRLAYLLHGSWPLPGDAPPAGGAVTTYAVFLTHYDGETLARLEPLEFPGVDLPGLPGHLRAAAPAGDWPPELLVLRALVAPDDTTVEPALRRCNQWPGFNLGDGPWPAGMPAAHAAVHQEATSLIEVGECTDGRNPDASLLRVDEHLAQLAMHCNEPFGHQQWFLFDTVWAAAHPDLAASLLRYAGHWDPLD